MGLFKTIGDLNLLLYSSSIGGVVSTGDVSASNFYEFISDLQNLKIAISSVFTPERIRINNTLNINTENLNKYSKLKNQLDEYIHGTNYNFFNGKNNELIKGHLNKYNTPKLNLLYTSLKLPSMFYHTSNNKQIPINKVQFIFESEKSVLTTSFFPQTLFEVKSNSNDLHVLTPWQNAPSSTIKSKSLKPSMVASFVETNKTNNYETIPEIKKLIDILSKLKIFIKQKAPNHSSSINYLRTTENNVKLLPLYIKQTLLNTKLNNSTKAMRLLEHGNAIKDRDKKMKKFRDYINSIKKTKNNEKLINFFMSISTKYPLTPLNLVSPKFDSKFTKFVNELYNSSLNNNQHLGKRKIKTVWTNRHQKHKMIYNLQNMYNIATKPPNNSISSQKSIPVQPIIKYKLLVPSPPTTTSNMQPPLPKKLKPSSSKVKHNLSPSSSSQQTPPKKLKKPQSPTSSSKKTLSSSKVKHSLSPSSSSQQAPAKKLKKPQSPTSSSKKSQTSTSKKSPALKKQKITK